VKRGGFTEDQIAGLLEGHGAGVSLAGPRREPGVGGATLYNRKARHGGMDVGEAKRLKGLEDDNARLMRRSTMPR
jgi:putative transposase